MHFFLGAWGCYMYVCLPAHVYTSCSPLLSLHFLCPGTWKAGTSLCTEMVCAIQNVLGCPGVDAEVLGQRRLCPGQVDKEQVRVIRGAGGSPALLLPLQCV